MIVYKCERYLIKWKVLAFLTKIEMNYLTTCSVSSVAEKQRIIMTLFLDFTLFVKTLLGRCLQTLFESAELSLRIYIAFPIVILKVRLFSYTFCLSVKKSLLKKKRGYRNWECCRENVQFHPSIPEGPFVKCGQAKNCNILFHRVGMDRWRSKTGKARGIHSFF